VLGVAICPNPHKPADPSHFTIHSSLPTNPSNPITAIINSAMKMILVVGARPNFMKIPPSSGPYPNTTNSTNSTNSRNPTNSRNSTN
jgi:hypothetical protein